MAERYEAYRRLVEDEKDAAIRAAERKLGEQLAESIAKAYDKAKKLAFMYNDQTKLYVEAVGTLAVHFKFHSLDWQLLKPSLSAELRQRSKRL